MVWLFLGVVLLVTLWQWRKKYNKKDINNLPPGPKGWPIVGNLVQLSTEVPMQRMMKDMAKKYGPVMMIRMGGVPVIMISSCNAAKEFFKINDAVFADRPKILVGRLMFYGYKGVALTPYGDHWRQAKKVCTLELISPKHGDSFRAIREAEADLMVESISNDKNEVVDVSKKVATFVNNVIWLLMIGKKFGDEHLVGENMTFKHLMDEISAGASIGNLGDYIPWLGWLEGFFSVTRRLKDLHRVFDKFMDGVLHERAQQNSVDGVEGKQKDFLGVLIEKNSIFQRDHIKALILDMFIAGAETSTTTTEWVMSLLLKNPRALKKAQEELDRVVGKDRKVREEHINELKYLKCILKETLRLYPTVPLLGPHFSMKETKVNGYDVPQGTIAFINAWALGRDGSIWESVEEFMPERFMNEENIDITGLKDEQARMMPFSQGRRGCPGAPLAIHVVLLAVATLIHSFDWSAPNEINMTEKFGLSIPRKFPLLASPSPRLSWVSKTAK